jgi:hypothetical protein
VGAQVKKGRDGGRQMTMRAKSGDGVTTSAAASATMHRVCILLKHRKKEIATTTTTQGAKFTGASSGMGHKAC